LFFVGVGSPRLCAEILPEINEKAGCETRAIK